MPLYTNRVYDPTAATFVRWDTATPDTGGASYPGPDAFGNTSDFTVERVAATGGVTDHGALLGLGDDDHSIYALLAGRATGQTLIGGTGATEDLVLASTSNASKGVIQLATGSNLDLNSNNILGVGTYSGSGTITLSAGNISVQAGSISTVTTGATIPANFEANGGDTNAVMLLEQDGTNAGSASIFVGGRTPEGNVDADPGSLYIRNDATPANSSIYIKTTALATLTGWVDLAASSPAGSDTQVQFNNSGSFGASGDFTWDGSLLDVTGNIQASGTVRGDGGLVVNTASALTGLSLTTGATDATRVTSFDNSAGANGAIAGIHVGDRNPQGAVSGIPGSIYLRSDGTDSSDSAAYVNVTAGGGPGTTWTLLGGAGGGATWLDLSDTPGSFAGAAEGLTGVDTAAANIEHKTNSRLRAEGTLVIDNALRLVLLGENGPGNWGTATGTDVIAIGDGTLAAITTQNNTMAIGTGAGESITAGPGGSMAFGIRAFSDAVYDNGNNTFMGFESGERIISGTPNGSSTNLNTAFGYRALRGAAAGSTGPSRNSAFGANAGSAISSGGEGNSLFGYNTGSGITTGQNNTIFGHLAGGTTLTTGDSNILIGAGVDTPAAGTSDHLSIGDALFADLTNIRFRVGGSGVVSGTAAGIDLNDSVLENIRTSTYNDVTADATPGATPTVDWTVSDIQELTLSTNVTSVTFTNPVGPARLTLIVKQPGGANYTMTGWDADIDWPGGTAPTITAANGAKDKLEFYWDGTDYYGTFDQNFS